MPSAVCDPPVLPLKNPRHLIFINKYQQTGFTDPITAYQETYGCKRESAKCATYRLLEKVPIQTEIAHRIQTTQVVTKDSLSADLVKYKTWAEEKKDYEAAASIVIDYAKLAGFLVEKREIRTLTDEQKTALRSLVDRALRPSAASSAPTSTPDPSASAPASMNHE